MSRPKFEPTDGTDLINVHTSTAISYGVAVVWSEGAEEFVVNCGTEKNARSYLAKIKSSREHHHAEIVHRDVIQVCGPWDSV